MPKVTIPGLGKSTGMKTVELLDTGKYVLECTKYGFEESKKSPGINHKFTFEVVEGIGDVETQKSGRDSKGMPFFENVFIMDQLHPSFEQYGHIGIDQIESMRRALKVSKKGDDIDLEAFVGKRCIAAIRQKADKSMKNDDGSPKINNEVSSWTADTGK